jgi:cyanophycinase-like exopeptidase
MARILQDKLADDVHGIGVDEKSVALLEADGSVSVVGPGSGAYFVHMTQKPEVCKKGMPLKSSGVSMYKVAPGGTFNVSSWEGAGGTAYDLQIEEGTVRPTDKDLTPYGPSQRTSDTK